MYVHMYSTLTRTVYGKRNGNFPARSAWVRDPTYTFIPAGADPRVPAQRQDRAMRGQAQLSPNTDKQRRQASDTSGLSITHEPKWYPFIDQLRMNSWVGWCHVWPRWDSNSRPRGNACAELADERPRPLGHTGIRTVYGQTKPSETARLVS